MFFMIVCCILYIPFFIMWSGDRCEKLTAEKENLEKNMEVLQRDLKLAAKGNKIKEIKVLKKVVQTLEVTIIAILLTVILCIPRAIN